MCKCDICQADIEEEYDMYVVEGSEVCSELCRAALISDSEYNRAWEWVRAWENHEDGDPEPAKSITLIIQGAPLTYTDSEELQDSIYYTTAY